MKHQVLARDIPLEGVEKKLKFGRTWYKVTNRDWYKVGGNTGPQPCTFDTRNHGRIYFIPRSGGKINLELIYAGISAAGRGA